MVQRYAAYIQPTKRQRRRASNKDSAEDDSGYEESSEETVLFVVEDDHTEVLLFNPLRHATREELQEIAMKLESKTRELEAAPERLQHERRSFTRTARRAKTWHGAADSKGR